jgi:hypothetical protein
LAIRGVPRARHGDFARAVFLDRRFQQRRAAGHDLGQLLDVVELEARDDAEAVAQRIGQHAGARGGADQGERLQVELHGTRGRAFADHDVDLVVLQRRIQDLLDHRRQAVDLVDEQDVVRFEVGQQRRQVARTLQHRAGGLAQVDAHLARDDVGQRGLAQARRAEQQRVVERFARLRAAEMKISSWSRIFSWPTYSSSCLGRKARSIASSLGESGRWRR